MAIKTLEGGRLHGDLVTLDTVRGSAQTLMRLRQRSRRDLRPGRKTETQHKTDQKERAQFPIATSDSTELPTSAANALFALHP